MDFEIIEGLSDEEISNLYEGTNGTGDLIGACTLQSYTTCQYPNWTTGNTNCSGSWVTSHEITSASSCKSKAQTGERNLTICAYLYDYSQRGSVSCSYGFLDGYPKTVYSYNFVAGRDDVTEWVQMYSRCTIYHSTERSQYQLIYNNALYWHAYKHWVCN